MQPILRLADIRLTDVDLVGGKAANLGELISAGLPVPGGFAITSEAYLAAIGAAGLPDELSALADVDTHDTAALVEHAGKCRWLIEQLTLPAELAEQITAAYRELGSSVPVAVRSSATAEDSAAASFAGMNASFTNVIGDNELLGAVQACWASLYGDRSIAYRAERGLGGQPAIAVVVQRMVASVSSGVMFTVDPSTGDASRMVIEAVRGQGESIVSGKVEPDTYLIDKAGPEIVDVRIGDQRTQITRGPDGHDREVPLDDRHAHARVIEESRIRQIARLGIKVEKHYGSPQDIEWAVAGGKVYLVQSRPITTLGAGAARLTTPAAVIAGAAPSGVLLRGLATSHGVGSGAVRVLLDPGEQGQLLDGEVLVAPMTSPDWVPAMRRAAALITDGGGMTCHAAIVSRELGLPCVVGTHTATGDLRNGQLVTVNGSTGEVLEGRCRDAGRGHPGRAAGGLRPARRCARHPHLRQPGDRRTRRPRWPPCRSTAWACSGRSSWWPTRSTGCTRGCCCSAADAPTSSTG